MGRLRGLTPGQGIIAMGYDADRRSDPTPANNWSSVTARTKLRGGKRTRLAVARPVDGMGEETGRIPAQGFAALCSHQKKGSTSSQVGLKVAEGVGPCYT